MSHSLTTAPEPTCLRVYITCLAAYNHGILHGCWIDVTTPDEIAAEVRTMLAASPMPDAEEFAIHASEGFEGVALSEYASCLTICELAAFITEHGKLGAKLLTQFGYEPEDARRAFEDYAGQYCSAAEFAEEMMQDCGTEIPEPLRYYIDWEALARDMALNGEIITVQTCFDEVHIFWTHQP